jgi:hypothetical protein
LSSRAATSYQPARLGRYLSSVAYFQHLHDNHSVPRSSMRSQSPQLVSPRCRSLGQAQGVFGCRPGALLPPPLVRVDPFHSLTRTRVRLTPHPHPSLESTQQLSISAQSGKELGHPAWTLPFPWIISTPHRHQHPCDCAALIRAFPREVHRLFAPSGACPASSDPGYPRISVPAPTPGHLRSAARLPAWACRPSPGSRSALASRTTEKRHRPPTRHANCNPSSALPWVGAALWSHQPSGTACRSNTRKTSAARFPIQLHPDVDGASSGHGRHARR